MFNGRKTIMTRKEAKDLMSNRHKHINKSSLDVIDEIYDSFGTCIECKYGIKYNDNEVQCELDGIFHRLNFYCADFKKENK